MSLFSRGSKRRASDEIREEDFQRFEDAPGTGGNFENPVSAVAVSYTHLPDWTRRFPPRS